MGIRLTERTRTRGIAAALMAAFIGILYVISHTVLLKSFAELEERSILAHVHRARAALVAELSGLDLALADWAAWDETYEFAQNANPGYIERNVPEGTFENLRLNLMAIVSSSGRLLFARGFDLQAGKRMEFPDSLRRQIVPGNRLLQHPSPASAVVGIVLLPEGPLLIASRPVLTNDRQGPIRGAIMMGRYLNATEIQRLGETTQLAITVRPADEGTTTGLSTLKPVAVEPVNLETITGLVLLNDIHGQPALILRVDHPRDIYGQGRRSVRYFLLWSIGGSLISMVLGVSTFEKLVLSRVRQQQSEERYRALVEDASPLPVFALAPDGTVQMWNSAAELTFGWTEEEVLHRPLPIVPPERKAEFESLVGRVLRGEGVAGVETIRQTKDGRPIDVSISAAPLRDANGAITGVLTVVSDITERKRAEERIRRQVQNLSALRTIDTTITASLDLRVTLNVFLEQVTTQLRVDAADVLLVTPGTQRLEFATGRGFRTAALQHTSLRFGEGHAGRAALERRMVSISNVAEGGGDLRRAPLLTSEEFVSYHAVPLIVKGVVKGVLEVFHRAALSEDQEWMDFLQALAGQAAIAIESATLFDDLQRANIELTLAYDTTLEGWSRALDLRDRETEGHTRRVTDLTVQLARAHGMGEDELVHVRRGALLHDIGKMGIPDEILRKPGALTDEERTIIQRHPVFAFELLSPIRYLRRALDIPYSHHEKWDGSGYPQGLRGEQIPLAARVFAVVDVWDALCSERPYRPAWPPDRVAAYIREQAGTHFDPEIVEAFLRMMSARGEASPEATRRGRSPREASPRPER